MRELDYIEKRFAMKITKSLLLLTLSLILQCCLFGGAQNTQINIAGLYSNADGLWHAESVRTISDIAVELVNETTILEGYELNVNWRASQCSRLISLNEFLELIQEQETIYHFVFGPSCSTAAEPIGEIVPIYNLNMLTSTSTSQGLTNEGNYPNTFLGMPTYTALVVVYIKLIEKFEWRRIGLINEDTGIFNTAFEILSDQVKKRGVEFGNERIVDGKNKDEVDRKLERLIYTQKFRVIIANFYEDNAYRIFCRASKLNYKQPYITWIIPSWFSRNWIEENHQNINDTSGESCSAEEIYDFIEGGLGVDNNVRLIDHNMSAIETSAIFKPDEMTIFNVTRGDLWNRIKYKLEPDPNQSLDPNIEKYAIYAFDAMVTLAILFDNALKIESELLSGFDYHDRNKSEANSMIAASLTESIYDIEFSGLTGKVSYADRSRKESRGEIVEFINGKEELVGFLSSIVRENVYDIDTYPYNIEIIREFGSCNKDGVKCDGVELHNLPIAAIAVTFILAVIALIFTVFFMVINIVYRKKKVVKLSSPFLNTVILSGAILQCIVAVLVIINNRFFERKPEDMSTCIGCTILCHLVWWLPALANDLIFGTLVGKAFRVHRIAIRQSINSKVKNFEIFLFVCGLMFLDTLYTMVWAAIPQTRLNFIAEGPQETGYNDITDVRAPFWYIFYCAEGGDPNSAAIAVRFVYIIFRWFLYAIGLYFAYQIRKINIRGVNEFQAITLATLATVLFNLVRIILITMIPSVRLIDAAISLLAISYVLDTFLVVSFIFVPKLYYILKDPKERKVYGGVNNTSEIGGLLNQIQLNKIEVELVKVKQERDSLIVEVRERRESLAQEFKSCELLQSVEEILEGSNAKEDVPVSPEAHEMDFVVLNHSSTDSNI